MYSQEVNLNYGSIAQLVRAYADKRESMVRVHLDHNCSLKIAHELIYNFKTY